MVESFWQCIQSTLPGGEESETTGEEVLSIIVPSFQVSQEDPWPSQIRYNSKHL